MFLYNKKIKMIFEQNKSHSKVFDAVKLELDDLRNFEGL